MDKALLNAAHTWTGEWWLPTTLTTGCRRAHLPEEGMHLNLIGGWKPRDLKRENGVASGTVTDKAAGWPIIHGVGDGS